MKHESVDPLYALQVRLLYENAPLAYLVTLINAAILGYIQAAVIPLAVILAWYACVLVITVLRLVMVRRYNRLDPPPERADFWNKVYFVGAAAAGTMWGAASIVLFPPDSLAHQLFLSFVLGGMAAGGVSVLAPRMESCLVFLLPVLVPLAIQYLAHGAPLQTAMGVMILIFLATLLLSARNYHQVIRGFLHLRFDKQNLEEAVSRHRGAQERLRQEKERLHATVSSIGESVVLLDGDGCIEYLNPAAERLFGVSCEEALHHAPRRVFECFDDIGRRASTALEDCVHSAESQKKQLVIYGRARARRIVEELATPLLDRFHHLVGAVSVFRDVTEEQQFTERLLHAATHDVLTGLPNRNLLNDRILHAIAHAHRNKESFGLLFIDLNGFKAVNDTLGHACGDALLVEVARRLKASVREEDTVARLGGDEFVVLIDNATRQSHVEAIADKIRTVWDAPFQLDGKSVPVSGSVGVSLYPRDGRDLGGLLAHADAAMYHAKQAGADRKA